MTEKEAPRSALDQPSTTTVSAQKPATKDADTHQPEVAATAAAAAVHDLAVGDRVLVSLGAGSPVGAEAKVVRVDNSRTPAMFRIRLKGSGKEIWRAAADVAPIVVPPEEGGQGVTGKEAGGKGVSERYAATTPVAETLVATDPGSEGKPKASGRKMGKKAKAQQRICPSLGGASAGETIEGAAPTLDFQAGDIKLIHKPTDNGEGSATPLAGEGAGGQSTSSTQDSPAEKSTARLATRARSHGHRGGISNSVRPGLEKQPTRVGVKNDTGSPESGREQRKQQRQQHQQEKQQNQRQQRKQQQQQQQQQQRGQQPLIDASAVVPAGSDSAGQEATVIETQSSDPPSVRNSAKNSRIEKARQPAEQNPSTTDVSVFTDLEGGGDGPEQAEARKSPTRSGNAEKTAQRAPEKTWPRVRGDGAAGGGNGVARGGPVVGTTRGSKLGDYWQNPPPRKRAAATAAASAISSSRIRRVAGRRDGRESDSATKNTLASKDKGATKRTSAGKVIRTPRKFGRGLQQRPKVVTPGSAQGRSEPALR